MLKDLDDGDEVSFLQGGPIVLIGDGHDFATIRALYLQDHAEGSLRIKKGRAFSAGKIVATGSDDEATFEAAIARISDKTVEFE